MIAKIVLTALAVPFIILAFAAGVFSMKASFSLRDKGDQFGASLGAITTFFCAIVGTFWLLVWWSI